MQKVMDSQLTDEQLKAFDHFALANYGLEQTVRRMVEEVAPTQAFSFLDVGGGNGRFSDFILEKFPRSSGTVVDNSSFLAEKNRPHPSKSVVVADATALPPEITGRTYDIVFCNFFLHHLITGSYAGSREMQHRMLRALRGLVAPRGCLFIIEELKDGFVHPDLSVRLIFSLTRSRLLSPMMRRLGANTAGVGVAFFSTRGMQRSLERCGYRVDRTHDCHERPRFVWRALLALRSHQSGAIIIARPAAEA
jgi:SAM-dependent methyltransferase